MSWSRQRLRGFALEAFAPSMKVCALLFALVAVAVAEGEDDEAVRSPPSVSNGACSALSSCFRRAAAGLQRV